MRILFVIGRTFDVSEAARTYGVSLEDLQGFVGDWVKAGKPKGMTKEIDALHALRILNPYPDYWLPWIQMGRRWGRGMRSYPADDKKSTVFSLIVLAEEEAEKHE